MGSALQEFRAITIARSEVTLHYLLPRRQVALALADIGGFRVVHSRPSSLDAKRQQRNWYEGWQVEVVTRAGSTYESMSADSAEVALEAGKLFARRTDQPTEWIFESDDGRRTLTESQLRSH